MYNIDINWILFVDF